MPKYTEEEWATMRKSEYTKILRRISSQVSNVTKNKMLKNFSWELSALRPHAVEMLFGADSDSTLTKAEHSQVRHIIYLALRKKYPLTCADLAEEAKKEVYKKFNYKPKGQGARTSQYDDIIESLLSIDTRSSNAT